MQRLHHIVRQRQFVTFVDHLAKPRLPRTTLRGPWIWELGNIILGRGHGFFGGVSVANLEVTAIKEA